MTALNATYQEQMRYKMRNFAIIVAAFMFLAVIAASFSGCGGKLTINNIESTYDDGYFYITANCDILNVEITYLTYDETGAVTDTYCKNIGDLVKNKTYKISVLPFILSIVETPANAEVTAITGEIAK